MPIDLLSRVRVTDHTSEHRGRLGVVKGLQDTLLKVRLDGYPDRKTVLLKVRQVQMSSQPVPVDYPGDEEPVTSEAAEALEAPEAPVAKASKSDSFGKPVEPKKLDKPKG